MTLADHLKKVRLDRGIPRRGAARGYDPRPEPAGVGGQIRAARETEGLSERELAHRLGLDPGTVAAWERGEMSPAYSRTW